MLAWLFFGAASALWSPGPQDSLKASFYDIVLPAGAFFGAYIISRDKVLYGLLAASVIGSFAMLAAFAGLAGWLASREASDPLMHGGGALLNYYPGEGTTSTLSVYGLPLALLLAGGAGYARRLAGYTGIACIMVAGITTDNRMFWPSAVAVLAAFWIWQWRVFGTVRRLTIAAVLILSTLLAVGMVLRLTGAGNEALVVVARDNRPAAWQEWWKIAAQAPILGYGLGLKTIKETALRKLPAEFAERNPEMQFHAHSLLLDIVLQTGVVGLALFAFLLATLAREAWQVRGDANRLATGGALIALLIGMLAKNATDDFMHHAVVIAFWGYAGIFVGRLRGADQGEVAKRGG
jgi:O-antigen ligase